MNENEKIAIRRMGNNNFVNIGNEVIKLKVAPVQCTCARMYIPTSKSPDKCLFCHADEHRNG